MICRHYQACKTHVSDKKSNVITAKLSRMSNVMPVLFVYFGLWTKLFSLGQKVSLQVTFPCIFSRFLSLSA